jgi:hypothetical protein
MYNNNNNNNNKIKTFTIIDFPEDNKTFGNFKSSIPKKAANEAFLALLNHVDFNKNNNDDNFFGKFIVFVIKEINTDKMYKYIGTVIKLKKPVNVKLNNGKEIIYHYKTVIGKYKKELDKIK